MGHFQCFLRMPDSASRISENSPPLQIRLRRHVNSSSNNRPSVEVLWAIRFRFQSRERQTAPRYSSSRASVLVSALRIMPLFIGTSLLLLFDFNGMAIGVTQQNGPFEPNLSVSESSFAGRFALGLRVPSWELIVVSIRVRGRCSTRKPLGSFVSLPKHGTRPNRCSGSGR
jgi:hypothetical protein